VAAQRNSQHHFWKDAVKFIASSQLKSFSTMTSAAVRSG
jgi:hypothetical protein